VVEGIIRRRFDLDIANPNSLFNQNFEAEKVLSMDTFRMNENDLMSVSDILIDALLDGMLSQTDFYHDRAFYCLLVLMTKVNEKMRRLQVSLQK